MLHDGSSGLHLLGTAPRDGTLQQGRSTGTIHPLPPPELEGHLGLGESVSLDLRMLNLALNSLTAASSASVTGNPMPLISSWKAGSMQPGPSPFLRRPRTFSTTQFILCL